MRRGEDAIDCWYHGTDRKRWRDEPKLFLKEWEAYESIRNIHVWDVKLYNKGWYLLATAKAYYEAVLKVEYPKPLRDICSIRLYDFEKLIEGLKGLFQQFGEEASELVKGFKISSLYDNTIFDYFLELKKAQNDPFDQWRFKGAESFTICKVQTVECIYREDDGWEILKVHPTTINQPFERISSEFIER